MPSDSVTGHLPNGALLSVFLDSVSMLGCTVGLTDAITKNERLTNGVTDETYPSIDAMPFLWKTTPDYTKAYVMGESLNIVSGLVLFLSTVFLETVSGGLSSLNHKEFLSGLQSYMV
ncbi:hypothetical protein CDAR_351 [Caerostris darwini]|uniref:Uncharacterized protein n=1 Tax=Caerostris darwini TaxID=1538125 RepID=A0AAV4QZU9_9ARAC|nr:hypothetical protein CDAR_351 [Caerostris darwini]